MARSAQQTAARGHKGKLLNSSVPRGPRGNAILARLPHEQLRADRVATPGNGKCWAASSSFDRARDACQLRVVRAQNWTCSAGSAPEDSELQCDLPHGSNCSQSCPLSVSPRGGGSAPSAGNHSSCALAKAARFRGPHECDKFEPVSARKTVSAAGIGQITLSVTRASHSPNSLPSTFLTKPPVGSAAISLHTCSFTSAPHPCRSAATSVARYASQTSAPVIS